MKSSAVGFLITVLLHLALLPVSRAQDAAAPIRRTSPSPAEATPTPEPESTPTPRPEEKATPEPTAPPTPEATPTPRPDSTPQVAASPKLEATPPSSRSQRVLREKPVRAVEPRSEASRRAAANEPRRSASRPTFDLTGDNWTSGSTLRALENRWQKAIMNGDIKTIDELVADDFVGTSSTGKVGSKSTLLNEVRRDKNIYKSATARNMSIRTLSPGVAVVTGVATESGTTPGGKSFTTSRRFTDTWRQRDGRWECVASHATQIPKR